MNEYYFTKEELAKLSDNDLVKLAKYFGAEPSEKMNRSKLVRWVYEAQKNLLLSNPATMSNPEISTMSVKIARIYSQMKEGK